MATWAPVLTTVITYPVMALNPFELGATQWTVAESLPPDAVTLEGAPGVVKLVSWNEAHQPPGREAVTARSPPWCWR